LAVKRLAIRKMSGPSGTEATRATGTGGGESGDAQARSRRSSERLVRAAPAAAIRRRYSVSGTRKLTSRMRGLVGFSSFQPKARKTGCKTNVGIPLTRSCLFFCGENRGRPHRNQYPFWRRYDLRLIDLILRQE